MNLADLEKDLNLPTYSTWSEMIEALSARGNFRPDWRDIVITNERRLCPGRLQEIETFVKRRMKARKPTGLYPTAHDRFVKYGRLGYPGDYRAVVSYIVREGITE